MKVMIVEDEPLIAQRLERMCREILPGTLESVRTAETFEGARAALLEHPVDVLLLDLNLHGHDGMDLLQSVVAGAFHTIIVSANIDQALRAFEYGVLDFVPKPFTRERLASAFARLGAGARGGPPSQTARYLAVRKHGRVEVVPVDDVVHVQGAGNYAELVLRDGRRELHDKTLERIAALLPPDFERIHKSHLVRLSEIVALHAHEGSQYEAELRDGTILPVGRTRYKELRARLS